MGIGCASNSTNSILYHILLTHSPSHLACCADTCPNTHNEVLVGCSFNLVPAAFSLALEEGMELQSVRLNQDIPLLAESSLLWPWLFLLSSGGEDVITIDDEEAGGEGLEVATGIRPTPSVVASGLHDVPDGWYTVQGLKSYNSVEESEQNAKDCVTVHRKMQEIWGPEHRKQGGVVKRDMQKGTKHLLGAGFLFACLWDEQDFETGSSVFMCTLINALSEGPTVRIVFFHVPWYCISLPLTLVISCRDPGCSLCTPSTWS